LQAPAERYSSYSALKRDVADAVIALLEPLQARYAELAADRAEPEPCCAGAPNGPPGLASSTLTAAKHAIGLAA